MDEDFVTHLVDLERPYDPDLSYGYDLIGLVRFALASTDYWADRALDWLTFGFPVTDLERDLRAIVDNKRRPQPLRHRAYRLIKPHA